MDLTSALAVTAAVVLAALAGHAWWSARRARPRQADPTQAASALAAEAGAGVPATGGTAERVEPSLGLPQEGAEGAGHDAEAFASGVASGVDAGPLPGRGPGRVPLRMQARLDPLIDAIVTLRLDDPVSGDVAVAHLPASWRAGAKPLYVEGLALDSGQWEQPMHGRTYGEFQAGVQLANRSGALTTIEYSEFVQKIQDFAESVGAMAELPDMMEVVARARELDAFARPLDAELEVLLRARSAAWSVGYLTQCASRRGLLPGVRPGRWVLPGAGEGDPPVLSLHVDALSALDDSGSAPALRTVRLALEVAHTAREAEPFPAWHRLATELAAEMDADIVDEAGRPVTLGVFDQIGRDLQRLYDELASRDLAAGTPAARRLFS